MAKLTWEIKQSPTVMEPPAKPNLGMSSDAGSIPGGSSRLQDSAAPQMPNTTVDTAVPGDQAPEMPTSSPEELMLRGVLRQFMPMLLTAVNQGGDGHRSEEHTSELQ